MTTFLLVRHGETDAVGHTLSGRLPGIHLNQHGKNQVERLAQRLSRLRIDAVYTSPLERAVETAEAIGHRMRLRPVIIEDFNEVQFGEWEGLTFEELAMRNEWRRFNLTRSTAAPPGGESMSEVQNRMSNQTESLSRKHEGQTVAVVSHCDPLRCLVVHWLGLSLDLMLRFELGPSSVTVGRTDSFQREILCLNWMEELPV